MRKTVLVTFLMCVAHLAFAQADLALTQEDVVIERNSGRSIGTSPDGYNLYVRRKEGMRSVMLVETTKDPSGQMDNFAYRAPGYNSLNGDEIRYLNGERLTSDAARYSLISSTVTTHPRLGDCFLIYIPPVMEYGYPWTRNGSVRVERGTFINVRTFTAPYGDYSGEFRDNPFMFDFPGQRDGDAADEGEPDEPPGEVLLTDDYSPVAASAFEEIARKGRGVLAYSKGPETLAGDLFALFDGMEEREVLDVVFAIDTTGSMKDDLEALQQEWIPQFREQVKDFGRVRLGLLFYRDYGDSYNFRGLPVKMFPFTENFEMFAKNLGTPIIRGKEGGDVPEAVYEALFASLEYFSWDRREGTRRHIVLVGDAEPHPAPRGKKPITQAMVMEAAERRGVSISCVIVPNKPRKDVVDDMDGVAAELMDALEGE